MATKTTTTTLATVFDNAGRPATLKQHASAIISANKSNDANKGKIIAHIAFIDRMDLWKEATNDAGDGYKSINAYLIDALDVSPAMASIWVNVGRMVLTIGGEFNTTFAPYTASQLQELLPLAKALADEVPPQREISEELLDDVGICPEMSCKAIREAVKAYIATVDDEANDEADDDQNDEAGDDQNDEATNDAGTIVDFLTEIDDGEDVREWLANCPNSIVDAVSTVLYKRV